MSSRRCARGRITWSRDFWPRRQYQEEGEFGEAILQCVETYQQLESGTLASLRVAPELRSLVQRHYYDTLSRLDTALQRCSASFGAEAYSKVCGWACGRVLQRFAQHRFSGLVTCATGM